MNIHLFGMLQPIRLYRFSEVYATSAIQRKSVPKLFNENPGALFRFVLVFAEVFNHTARAFGFSGNAGISSVQNE